MTEYRDATFSMVIALHGVAAVLVILNLIQLYGEGKVDADKVKMGITVMAYLTLLVVVATGILFILGWADDRI